MVCEPTARVAMEKVAVPLSPSGRSRAPLSPPRKSRCPSALPVVPAAGATVAVKVTIWPMVEELREDPSVVVSADGVTLPDRELRDEGVAGATAEGRLKGVLDREIARAGETRDVHVAGRVHGDGLSIIIAVAAVVIAAEVGRVLERRAVGVELRNEGVEAFGEVGLHGVGGSREVVRIGGFP